jgi:hypothetical protein
MNIRIGKFVFSGIRAGIYKSLEDVMIGIVICPGHLLDQYQEQHRGLVDLAGYGENLEAHVFL